MDFFSSLLCGILCALALTALCLVVAKGLSGKRTNILIAILLFIPLAYECVLGSGALYARVYVSEICDYVGVVTDNISVDNVDEIVDAVSHEYPAVPSAIMDNVRTAASSMTSATTLTNIVEKTVNDTIMSYFWKRVLWTLGFMIAGTTLLVYFAPENTKSAYRKVGHSFDGSSYDCDYNPTSTSRSRYCDYE